MRTMFTLVVVGFVLAGCANKPVPKTFAGFSTFNIMQKIRCEAQAALRKEVIRYLESTKEKPDVVARLKQKDITFQTALDTEFEDFTPETQEVVNRYRKSQVILGFTFDVTENNNFNGSVDFLDVITGGTFNLGIKAQKNLGRQNVRTFDIRDPFEKLVTDEKLSAQCKAIEAGTVNFYPIKGDLGLDEIFATYFKVDWFAEIISKDNVASFADTMTFTTELVGEFNPSVNLSTGVTHITLASAGIGGKAIRKDVNILEIAIQLPAKTKTTEDPQPVAQAAPKDPKSPEKPQAQFKQVTAEDGANYLEAVRERIFRQNSLIVPR